jgi:predicted acyl esterase
VRRRALGLLVIVGLLAAATIFRASADSTYAVQRGVVTSFDGTPIVYNYFTPAAASAATPVPLIMRTHGWGGTGETTAGGTLGKLLDNGYAVVTWDERGFGASGGEANVDDINLEGRDAAALLDVIAARPEILKESGDPVVGMTGGSYAGGIQLALASIDSRIDAIAPEITWNDLNRSLWQGDVIKLGWGELLYGAGLATAATGGFDPRSNTAGIQTGAYAPFIHEAEVKGASLGYPDQATKDAFGQKGLATYGNATRTVRVPTLLMQGKTDTLFDLNEAYANFKTVVANGAPAKLIAFCGGHAGCPSYNNDGPLARAHQDDAILAWFAKYLKGDTSVSTGAAVEWSLGNGTWQSGPGFPTAADPQGATIAEAQGSGSVVNPGALNQGENQGTAIAIADSSTSGQPDTLTIPVATAGTDEQVVGIGQVTGSITGVGSGTNLIFKLVDRESHRAINGQAATLRVDGPFTPDITRAFSVDLVGVAELLPAGHHLDLEVSTTGLPHATYRGAGVFTVAVDRVAVPVLPLG